MGSQTVTARMAGIVYVAIIVTGVFSIVYVPAVIVARGDAAATAQNVLSHALLFRLASRSTW